MEIQRDREPAPTGSKIVFIRIPDALYQKLEQVRVRSHGRGIATVVRQTVEAALAEGITVRGEKVRTRRSEKAA